MSVSLIDGHDDREEQKLKEFAEKVKQKTLAMICSPDEVTTDDYIACIDETYKEMVGADDENI